MNSFQNHHLINLLSIYEDSHLPLDYFVSQYFRHHKALGSKDRAIISETIYGLVRWKGLLDYLLDTPKIDWTSRLETFQNLNLDQLHSEASIPPHIRVSFPENLFNLIVESHGFEQGFEICWNSNFPTRL